MFETERISEYAYFNKNNVMGYSELYFRSLETENLQSVSAYFCSASGSFNAAAYFSA